MHHDHVGWHESIYTYVSVVQVHWKTIALFQHNLQRKFIERMVLVQLWSNYTQLPYTKFLEIPLLIPKASKQPDKYKEHITYTFKHRLSSLQTLNLSLAFPNPVSSVNELSGIISILK